MPTLIFYDKPVPLDREAHRNARLKWLVNGYRYAASCNAYPLAAIEFANACHDYPIVFMLDAKDCGVPTCMVGLHHEENLFVSPDGSWQGAYIPAFVRRYPFALHTDAETGDATVLIDEGYAGFGAPDGELLFTGNGDATPMLAEVLEFLESFKADTLDTNAFVTRLRKLDLLVPQKVDVKTLADRSITVDGFYVVDEQRLTALDDAKLLALARNGDLGRIYAHLLSLNNVHKLATLLER